MSITVQVIAQTYRPPPAIAPANSKVLAPSSNKEVIQPRNFIEAEIIAETKEGQNFNSPPKW